MKKILTIFAVLCMATSSFGSKPCGDPWDDGSLWDDGFGKELDKSEINHSGMFVNAELSYFKLKTDYYSNEEGVMGANLDLGYRWHIWKGISWDIIKIGATSGFGSDFFKNNLTLRFVSGIHYNFPAFKSGQSMFIEGSAGGCWIPEHRKTIDCGFAYGFCVGINFNRTMSLGIAWDRNEMSYYREFRPGRYDSGSYDFLTLGLRLGINF